MNKEIKDHIKNDLLLVQASQSKELFYKAVELFELKWEAKEPVFIKYSRNGLIQTIWWS